MAWVTLCFLYRYRPARDVLAHWAGNLDALGLRGTVKLREHHSWDTLKRGEQRVWWAAHATRFGLYCVELELHIRSRPKLLREIDHQLASVGSSNLDNRSMRLNFEGNLVVEGKYFNDQIAAMLEQDMARSRLSDAGDLDKSLPFRLAARLSQLFSPIL